jgi:hypothetical protein
MSPNVRGGGCTVYNVHISPNKLWRSNSIVNYVFNLCMVVRVAIPKEMEVWAG